MGEAAMVSSERRWREASSKSGKLESPDSWKRISESSCSVGSAPSSWGLRCHEKRRSWSLLWRPKKGEATSATGVEMGVESAVEARPRSLLLGE